MRTSILVLALALLTSSCAELEHILNSQTSNPSQEKELLTNEQIIQGLKGALDKGTDYAVSDLSRRDGFLKNEALKILHPVEAKPIYERVEKIPILSQYLDSAVVSVNRAAEDASTQAKPIFLSAIKAMSIQDAMGILRGSDSAATHYLEQQMRQQLYEAFRPKIEASLQKKYVGNLSAENTYAKAIDYYNAASLKGALYKRIENNSLVEHTTQKALDALFIKLAEEEKAIRVNPTHRVTEILQKVFGWQF